VRVTLAAAVMSETTSVTWRLARQILRLPSWVGIPLLAAFVVGLLTGVRIFFALVGVGSHGRRGIGLALPVLVKAVLAAASGGLAYALCRDPLARLGRFGSILSGAVLIFTYLVGCAIAFEVKHIDGIAIGVAIGISLVGGAILKPGRLELDFIDERYGALAGFCGEYLSQDGASAPRSVEQAVQSAREREPEELIEELRVAVSDLRRDHERTRRQLADELLYWKNYSGDLEEFLERIERALALRAP